MARKRLDIVFFVNKYFKHIDIDYALLLSKYDYDVIWSDNDEILALFNTLKKEREKIAKLMKKYVEVK